MPCNFNTICYIDEHNEMPTKSNFITNAMRIVNSRHQKSNVFIYIITFYPKDINMTRDSDLERFKKGDIIQVQGRFLIIETEVDNDKIKLIKVKNLN